jgi:hypothetical protein
MLLWRGDCSECLLNRFYCGGGFGDGLRPKLVEEEEWVAGVTSIPKLGHGTLIIKIAARRI